MKSVVLNGDQSTLDRFSDISKLSDAIQNVAESTRWNYLDHREQPLSELSTVEESTALVYLGSSANLYQELDDTDLAPDIEWIILINTESELSSDLFQASGVTVEHIPVSENGLEQKIPYLKHRLSHYLSGGLNSEQRVGVELVSSLPLAITPLLRGMQQDLEQLIDQGLSKDIRQRLTHILDSLTRSQNLVDELEMFNPQSQNFQFEDTASFKIENVFNRLEQHLARLLSERDVDLKMDIDNDLPDLVEGNESLLHRILFQLLLNSCEHTRQGHIQCSAELVSWPDDEMSHLWVRFEVTDTGVGMSSTNLERVKQRLLFEGRTGKLGAGFALVQLIVDRLGGTFELESQEQVGTRCTIQLPFGVSDEASIQGGDQSDEVPDLSEYQILIVEDNPVNMSVISQVISETGATITTAEHGQQAIEILKVHPQDLIMMDVQMPVMDGLETTKTVLANYESWHPGNEPPKIIALTAAAMDGDRERCLEAGMVDYITKPFRAEDVFETLAQWLSKNTGTISLNKKKKAESVEDKSPKSTQNGSSVSGKRNMVTDIDRLREYAQGNEVIVVNMIDVFLKHTPEYVNLLRSHTEDENWKLVKKQAHKMKPQMGYVGLNRVVILLERIEEEVSTRQRVDQVRALLRKVEQLCDRAMEELAMWKDQHNIEMNE